jgi:hypothetical protein
MFQSRQINEIYNLVEVSFATFTLAASNAGTTFTQNTNFVLNNLNSPFSVATFALGDIIELYPSASVGTVGGLVIQGTPTSTPGQLTLAVFNRSGSTITPGAGQWICVAKRIAPNLF